LTALIIVTEAIGAGVFFAFLLGWIYADGGQATLDITQFGEQHIEFFLMALLVATVPYALYVLDPET
jgi:uncharacterized membrane protein YeaQ/YmgE (transglycosylase-associated protein family)